MSPFENEISIDMDNAMQSLTKEELQIFNILIGKIQDYENIKFHKAMENLRKSSK